ncbi:hypothetical protein KC960_04735 [Candidatus Saccharibacteria bacterium]|nr:hypothetical protein [Candidatus Saccharibacteria bacterium]MCA9346770.1 hypothetical protein [Candidatus Saccharibacteria bacterium]
MLQTESLENGQTLDHNQWFRADQLYPEMVKQANEITAEFVGSVALEGIVSVDFTQEETTLLDALRKAKSGDLQAREVVRMSVVTDLAERMYKSKNHTRVNLDFKDGRLTQNGRSNTEVLGNTFRHTNLNEIMYRRAFAEQSNAFLFDRFVQSGITDEFDVLVASATTNDLTTKKRYNFFTKTDTMSLQLLSVSGSQATLDTAFVAGKVASDAKRHDLLAIQKLADNHGVDLLDVSEDDLVQYVILVPKGSLPNGIASIVEEYDVAAGGTFYGEAEPQQDYKSFMDMCLRRNFDDFAEGIVSQLIDEVDKFKDAIEPLKRLGKLAGKTAVLYAVTNIEIDTDIFGEEASQFLKLARVALSNGDLEGFELMLDGAMLTERSNSCPLEYEMLSGGEDEYGSLEFDCPECHQTNRRMPGQLVASCQHCSSRKVAC